jgi:P27 family predicted phage terminase small subunit
MAQQAKTIREHLLHGTVPQGKPERPSVYQGGRPKFPAHLSKLARQEMKRVVRILEKRGTVTEGDFAIAAVHAEVYARWVACKAQIGDALMVVTQVTDNNGNLRTVSRLNPLIKVAQQCESRLQSLAKDLGLSPITRDKVKPTALNQEEEIIPGSIADLCPNLLKMEKKS